MKTIGIVMRHPNFPVGFLRQSRWALKGWWEKVAASQ